MVASRFTEIVYKSSSEDSQKCRSRFKLFVDLLDSLKQGTTGQLSIYDSCWLLQTVPGFADFAGVAEITRLNTSEFLYLSGWKVQQWTCIRIQFCLFKQHWRRNYRAVYPTAHKVCLWFFWFNQLLPQTLKLEENIYIVLCLLLRFSCFWPTMNSLMLLKERSFANSLLIWKFIQKSCFLDRLFACWFLRKLWASSFARSVKFLSLHSGELATEVVLHGTFCLDSKIHSQNVYFHHSFWSEQTLAATKLFLSLTRIDFVVAASSRAVPISSRAVRVFPALSLRRVRPSYGTFSLMVFQGNCARGRMGHNYDKYVYVHIANKE